MHHWPNRLGFGVAQLDVSVVNVASTLAWRRDHSLRARRRPMSRLDEVAERDSWRCWLCDEPVDPQMSVNDGRGPSVDGLMTAKAAKGKSGVAERLAHRGCNTRRGAIKAVVPWPTRLFVAEPAPLIGVAERLGRKGGREVVALCPSRADADETADWLVDRFSRLAPELAITTSIEPGGGQFMVALTAPRR